MSVLVLGSVCVEEAEAVDSKVPRKEYFNYEWSVIYLSKCVFRPSIFSVHSCRADS